MTSRPFRVAAASLAIAASLLAVAAQAQEPGDGSEDCLRLEGQLAALDRSGPRGPDPRALSQQVAKQENELARNQSFHKEIGCGPRFLFAPAAPAECGPLEQRIKQMQATLEQTRSRLAQASQGGGVDPRRRELLFALARGQCGPQYRLVERRVEPQRQEKKGFFEMLFGGGRSTEETGGGETIVEPEMDPGATRISTYRTVCVRTCDGFFFPISYQTTQNAFRRDEAICQATCPGAQAKLFSYTNPGGKMETASDNEGQPYTKLENAFRYRKEFVQGCSCKPEGMDWAQALQGVDDKTVKQGDIVVDEKTANDLSRARSPEEAQAQQRAAAKRSAEQQAQRQQQMQSQEAQPTGGVGGYIAPDQTGTAGRGSQSDDIIILDQPRGDRSRIESQPLDPGPTRYPPY